VKHLFGNTWQLSSASGTDARREIFNFAVGNNLGVLTLNKEDQKMEDVFRQLTRRSDQGL
jgi:ABC-2 type transport system ATP-binding protein